MPRLFQGAACVFVLALVLPLITCGGSDHSSDELYVLVSANIQVPYWKAAAAGFSQAASQLKVRHDFVGPNEYDPKAEKDAFDQAVAKKATGILVSAADANLLKGSIDAAIAAGVPVITIDSDAPESKRLFFIGTNNYQAGVTGGQRLAAELKGKGNVVVFTMPAQANLTEGYADTAMLSSLTHRSKSYAWSILPEIHVSPSIAPHKFWGKKKTRWMHLYAWKLWRAKRSQTFSTLTR